MSHMIATSQDYQRGYDDGRQAGLEAGLSEGEAWGWEQGKEAAAMAVDSSLIRKNITDALSELIRELKKP